MATSNIQVVFEIGHTAFRRPDASEGSLTHDWIIFLRVAGADPGALQHFVRKVCFNLHPSFANPLRVCEKPPYQVIEAGYGGFMLPVDVYFKGKNDDLPSRIRFDYDLTLFPQDSINCLQTEKISFRNPTPDFRKKLLEGGGNGVMESDLQAVLPDRRLMQSFEHLPGVRKFGGPLLNPPTFDEFAKLFGLSILPPAPPGKRSSAEPSANRSRKASSGSSASSTTGERPKSAAGDTQKRKPVPVVLEVAPPPKKPEKAVKKDGKEAVEKDQKEAAKKEENLVKPDEKPARSRSASVAAPSAPPAEKEKKSGKQAKKETKLAGPITPTVAATTELEPQPSTSGPTDLSSAPRKSRPNKQLPPGSNDQAPSKNKPKSETVVKAKDADEIESVSSLPSVTPARNLTPDPSGNTTGNWPSPANSSAFMSPRTNKSASGLPVTPSWNEDIKLQMGVPKMLSPLPSPPSSPEENWRSSGSSSEEDEDPRASGHRRASTGFHPSHDADRKLPLVEPNSFVSALSDPSDTEDSPAKPRPPRPRTSTKTTPSSEESHFESDLENLKDVARLNQPPISPVDDREEDDLPGPFSGPPPRILSADEEYERYKLQIVVSQLSDRGIIQSIVDVLDPLGAFEIDEKAGTFAFNLYVLDDAVVEKIKSLSRFHEYDFEEDPG